MRWLLVLATLLLWSPALADMYQDASNAKLPEAMQKLLSGGALVTGNYGQPGGQPRIYAYGPMFGTTSGGGIFSPYVFNTDGDVVNCSSAAGCYGAYFGHNFGGATVKGNRTGLGILLNMSETTGNATEPTMWYTALGAESRANVHDGGTVSVPRGDVFGANFIATLTGTSANMNAVVGVEIDVSAGGVGPVAYKSGLSIIQQTTDVHQGTVDDVALMIANQNAGVPPGWKSGIAFGSHSGWWPMTATGTMIGTIPPFAGGPVYAAANGVDFSAVTFSGAAFKSAGFQVTGAGRIIATLPANCTGAVTGTLWNDAGTVKVCP